MAKKQKILKAKVIDFNRLRGEGLIRTEGYAGIQVIYACNLPGKKTWYAETACVYYETGDQIEITSTPDGMICLTPGIFDKAKWDGLDQSRLAFRCDEDGKALNGLFAAEDKKEKRNE